MQRLAANDRGISTVLKIRLPSVLCCRQLLEGQMSANSVHPDQKAKSPDKAERLASPLSERLTKVKALADGMGPNDPDFDMKRYSDEMWGED